MAKRGAQARQQMFNIDLESLLMAELSPLKQNDSESSTSEPCKHPKKFKTKENEGSPVNKVKRTREESRSEKEEIDGLDVSDEVRKSRLGQFTDSVISIYQSKITEMIKKQELETEKLKEQTTNSIEEELSKHEDEFKKLKQQENKLMKLLEQQLKMLQKAIESRREWTEHFRKLHHKYTEAFEELNRKHKNEALELQKSLDAEVFDLQSKFLVETKKEEVKTFKKYFSSIYF